MSEGSFSQKVEHGTAGGMGEFRWFVNMTLNKSESHSEKLTLFLILFEAF